MERKVENVAAFAKVGETNHIIMKGTKGGLLCCNPGKQIDLPKGDKLLELKDVNCARCKRLAIYKELSNLSNWYEGKDKQKRKSVDKKEEAKQPPPKEKKKKTINKAMEEKKEETIHEEAAEEKNNLEKGLDAIEKSIASTKEKLSEADKEAITEADKEAINKFINKLRQYHTELGQAISNHYGQFMGRLKSNFKFEIYHVHSNAVIFDNVEPKAIGNCLFMLNNIRIIWSGHGTPGSNYITTVRKAFEIGYVSSELNYPESFEDFKPKQRAATKKQIKKLPIRKKKGRKGKTIKKELPAPLPVRKKRKNK